MSNKPKNRDKIMADVAITIGAALTCMVFSAQFIEIPKNPYIAALLLGLGIFAVFWARHQWNKV